MTDSQDKPSLDKIKSSIDDGAYAVISAGIEAVKGGKTPTFVYSGVIIVILWAVGLLFAWQPLEAWGTLSKWTTMTTMCLVLLIITFLSFFPALVYLAFNTRGKEWAREHAISELQHYNLHEKFGTEVKDRFDSLYEDKSYWVPVPLATLTLVVGWVLVFFSGGAEPVANLAATGNISDLLVNVGNAHPVVFGFLGAFFFSLRNLFQRYVTADLKASVFMHIAVRIWVVMILIMVLSVVLPVESFGYQGYPSFLAVCFIAGFIPDVALNLIWRAARGHFVIRKSPTSAHLSLDKIRGLNLWHQDRLAEEGIDSVQNLAMADIIGLIVNTRLGIMRLQHWVDQALLIVHVGEDNLERFYRAGIRTATDFEAVYVGQLAEDEKTKLRECQGKLLTYMGWKGPSYIPKVPPGLLKSLREVEPKKSERNKSVKMSEKDEGLEERVRNMMIAICDDVKYQRLWKVRHRELIQ